MDKLYSDFINLLVSFTRGEKKDTTNMDLKNIYKLAQFHSLKYMFLSSLDFNDINYPLELKFEKQKEIIKCTTQLAELDSIRESFNEASIDFLPLKGSIIRTYYPDPAYRSMADLDILVHKSDFKKARKIILKLGYEKNYHNEEAAHDSFMKKPFMEVELHRKLVLNNAITYNYLIKTLDRTYKKDNHELALSDNDFYIYIIIHSAKHFSAGGTGIRILFDLHYMYQNKLDLDFEYIKNTLKEFEYDTYEEILRSIATKLFNSEELNNEELDVLEFLMTSGTYGTVYNGILTDLDEANNENKNKYLFKRLFPPLKTMKQRNPILRKLPFLLPFFWFTRLIKGLFHFKEHNSERKQVDKVDEEALNKQKRIKEITKMKGFYSE